MWYVHDETGYIYSRWSDKGDAQEMARRESFLRANWSDEIYPVGTRAIALNDIILSRGGH